MRFFTKEAYALVSPIEVWGGYPVVTNYEYTIVTMREFFKAKNPVILYPLSIFDEEYLEIKKKFEDSFSFICLTHRVAKGMGLGFLQGASIIFYPKKPTSLFELINLEQLDVKQTIIAFSSKFTSLKVFKEVMQLPSYNSHSGFLNIFFILNTINFRLFQYNKFILNINFKLINYGKYNSIRA